MLKVLTVLLLLLVSTTLLYSRALSAGPVYSDWLFVPTIESARASGNISFSPRGLTGLSYWLDTTAQEFHRTNVLLHLLNGSLVLWLFLQLGVPRAVTYVGTLLFLVHPLASQAVFYISARSDLLATTGILLAANVFLTRWRGRLLLVLLICCAAIWAKESAIVGVGLMWLLASLRLERVSMPRWLWLVIGGGIVGCVGFVVQHFLPGMQSPYGWWSYLSLQATALWYYTGAVILPRTLSIDHDFETTALWLRVLALGSLFWITAFLVCLWWMREYLSLATRCIFGGLLFVLIALAPRMVLPLAELTSERHLYLPMVGYALVAATVLVLPFLPTTSEFRVHGLSQGA